MAGSWSSPPGMMFAAAPQAPLDLPWWSVLPFVALLLCIALLPLFAGHFWHSNLRKGLVSVGLALPVLVYLYLHQRTTGQPSLEPVGHALAEYFDFIMLLTALYTVAGGIVLEGSWQPTPRVNTAFLAFGAVLANVIGTTGASMLLIKPVLRINLARMRNRHIPVFFIFVVSNLGGLLTPLGDPPLFLGFLHGVSFFWTMTLWPQWLLANGLVLAVFLAWDSWAYSREPTDGDLPGGGVQRTRVRGKVNIVFLAGIILAVLLQSEVIARPLAQWLGKFVWLPGLQLHHPWGGVVMGALAILSFLSTPRALRQANSFSWEAMIEVAVLFIGIFITMVPPLQLLAAHGHALGLTRAWQYFWSTGSLSAFLDNAPTYLSFATIAAGGDRFGVLMTGNGRPLLEAISCGAVFLGAMTYIGNGPNFMVKAIAESAGYRMPSFFGYLLYSSAILLPMFGLITVLFFR